MRFAVLTLTLFAVAACGKPRELPVTLRGCSGEANGITASVRNDADRPIKSLDVSADFYANFRFVRSDGSATFPGGLNPGDAKDTRFLYGAGAPAAPSGRASRCVVTHIQYLDGTSAQLPPESR